jgi:hypothetical protein
MSTPHGGGQYGLWLAVKTFCRCGIAIADAARNVEPGTFWISALFYGVSIHLGNIGSRP